MAKIADAFQRIMDQGSLDGPRISRDELIGAVRASSPAEVLIFAQQALDSIADGELVRLIAEKVGPERIPKPTNSLLDFPATKKWHDGALVLKKANPDADSKDAIRTLQRALVKIGAHHDGGRAVAKLLQLPWAADGDLGQTTIDALNAAMRLAGRNDLANLTLASAIDSNVAKALEGLLAQTIPLVHPALLNAPPGPDVRNSVVFVGMGDYSKHEADAVRRALPAGMEMAYVGDSALGDDVIKVSIAGRSVVFDLKTDVGRDNFVAQAFSPPLGGDQRAKVKEALEAQAWGITDARDEIAMMALEFHKVDSSNGRRAMPFLYVSGHSAGGGVWGDHNGQLPMESLRAITQAFPKAAATVEAPFFAACNHLHPANVEEFMKMFPNMKHAGGYSAYAPGTWVGGIAHCLAWMASIKEGKEVITPEMLHAQLANLKRQAGADKNNPLYYANEKKLHLATWNTSDGIYRWHEHNYADDSYTPQTREMRPDPAEIRDRYQAVQQKQAEFQSLLDGRHPNQELRDVEPHGDNLAREFYELAGTLSGTMGLSREQSGYAEKWKTFGLYARYYGTIVEKFGAADFFGPLIQQANAQLGAIGFGVKTAAQLASKDLKRKAMLDYIDSLAPAIERLRGERKPFDKATQLQTELKMRIAELKNIPSSWT